MTLPPLDGDTPREAADRLFDLCDELAELCQEME